MIINTAASKFLHVRLTKKIFHFYKIQFLVIYNQSEIRLVWNKFEAYPGEYPLFKIRYWYTAECERWENPIPVTNIKNLSFKTC